MKRILSFVMAAMLLIALCAFTACQDDKTEKQLTGISYKEGFKEVYAQNEIPNYTSLKVVATYDDESTEDISYNSEDFTIEFDTSVESDNVIVAITYKGLNCQTTVKVEKARPYDIVGVEAPKFVSEYKTNVGEGTDFLSTEDGYYVGDDNPFIFRPELTAIAGGDLADAKNAPMVGKVELVNGDSLTEVDSAYATFDGATSSVSFTEEAIGKTFKLSVYPEELSAKQMANVEKYTVSFEFTVIDGYNCYNAKDLSVIYLNKDEKEDDAERADKGWKEFRAANGITVNPEDVNAVILHSEIKLEKDSIPSAYFFNEGDNDVSPSDKDYDRVVGSLRDYMDIYYRTVDENAQFSIIGNYFLIDASLLPKVVRSDNKIMDNAEDVVVAHSTLFYINGTKSGENSTELFTLKNTMFKGNLGRNDGNLGGLIISKANEIRANFTNLVSREWYISYFALLNFSYNPVTFDKCALYDNYNCFFYNYGGYVVYKNSVIGGKDKGAGGPAIISDHVRPKNNGGNPSENIFIDTEITNYVAGQEAWFVQFGATEQVTMIKQLDGLLNPFGRTFLKKESVSGTNVDFINLMIIYKSSSAEGLTAEPIKGTAKFIKNETVVGTMDMANPYTGQFIQGAMGAGSPAVVQGPVPESGTIVSGSGLIDPLTMNITAPNHPVYTGDYLTIFLMMGDGYMTAVFGGYKTVA